MEQKILKRAERVLKGGANKNRVRILDYIAHANITSVWAISQKLDISLANASQHLQRLEKAGLVEKHANVREVYHELTPYGHALLKFINDL